MNFKCWSRRRYKYKELANLVASIVGYDGEIIWDSSKPDGTPRNY